MAGNAAPASPRPRWLPPSVLVLTAAAAVYAWIARKLFQDDAFIHLRIARNLMQSGFYSFNGDTPTFCTSSPLYTALLGVWSSALSGPLAPKWLNLACYVVLFALIAAQLWSARTQTARVLTLAFLAAVASPFAMRWLMDGMETGLVGVAALLLSRAACAVRDEPRASMPALAAMFALGAVTTTLRVEFAFVVALIGAASLLRNVAGNRLDSRAIALAAGSAGGLLAIWLVFHSFLPDTAIAKAGIATDLSAMQYYLATGFDIATAHAAASMLGVGVLGAWLLSAVLVMRRQADRPFNAALNAGLPLFLTLVILRHQAIQGYRYFVFIEFFLLSVNILTLDRSCRADRCAERNSNAWPGPAVALAAGFAAVLFAAWQTFDVLKLSSISAGRSKSYEDFVAADLTFLNGKPGIAWDVGMIGYFSGARILDGNGLVNGRAFATLPKRERLRHFATNDDVLFVFADDNQLKELRGLLSTDQWERCGAFDFPNFRGAPETHYLLVRNRNNGG